MNQRKKLLKIYYDLSIDEKNILCLKALISQAYSSYNLYQAIQSSGITKASSEKFKIKDIDNIIRHIKKNGLLELENNVCNSLIMHEVMKDAVQNKQLLTALKIVQKRLPAREYYYSVSYERLLRDCRVLLYLHSYQDIKKTIKNTLDNYTSHLQFNLWQELFDNIPLDIEWMQDLPADLISRIVYKQAKKAFYWLEPCDELIGFLQQNIDRIDTSHELLAEYYLLAGKFTELITLLKSMKDSYWQTVFYADFLFCTGKIQESIDYYEKAFKQLCKETHKRKIFFYDYHGVFYIFALLSLNNRTATSVALEGIQTVLDRYRNEEYIETFYMLKELIGFLAGETCSFITIKEKGSALAIALLNIISCLIVPDQIKEQIPLVKKRFNYAIKNKYMFIGALFSEILKNFSTNNKPIYQNYLDNNASKIRFLDLVKIKPVWERVLDQLLATKNNEITKTQERRISWLFAPDNDYDFLQPVEQILSKNGRWSKGKNIALKRLYNDKVAYITSHDRKICKAIEYNYYNYRSYEWNRDKALVALIGNQHIYHMQQPNMKLELIAANPELIVSQIGEDFHVKLSIINNENTIILKKETSTRYQVIEFNNQHIKLAKTLTPHGIVMPMEAKDKLLSTVAQIADILTVYTPLECKEIPRLPACSIPEVQLFPYEDVGIQANIAIKPFGDFGPMCIPGRGSPVIVGVHNAQKVQVVRELEKEAANLEALLAGCPIIKEYQPKGWIFNSPDLCLKLLSELKTYAGKVKLVWPHGERFKVQAALSLQNINLRIRQEQDWFAIEGDVQVEGKTLMNMQELLSLLDNTDQRFIPLEDNKFITLTEHFKKQLQQLKSMANYDGKNYSVHKLSALALNDVIENFPDAKLAAAWQEQVAKIKSSKKLKPQLPKQLTATLRPYQQKGYNWLCTLANWEVGACLADDMGLGKTLQAIAILLKYANKGPSLVVAPTSVCHNWLLEINRFAPTLKAHIFAEHNREDLINKAGKKQIIICSYGLLQNSINLLKKQTWQLIVLDEAQAIKNSTTKRAKAVFQLSGTFKLALTGTPIENHLGELWSLFRFLNPGFLSTEKNFFQNFIVPIEKHKNEMVRDTLRKLIRPFILRRLKHEVLKELPPRIEQNIEIELSEQEQALYEAIRAKAVEHIENMEEVTTGQKRIKILSEITKLRQACCHPSLVHPEMNIESTKLKHFSRLLNDILENKHRVLVFSQFVRYLSIVREVLEQKNISYQYLDGQTPVKKRKQIIADFQKGNTDIFLLSLKAGGVGLNLTAADYVILLDPWWNPAVEDQAADRAHRIGQTKPVTIYRLINAKTIEEKIVQLHKHKKNLANDILSGTNTSSKLSEDELLSLIEDTPTAGTIPLSS
jgi:superfamily II DNA or RNA helicase